METLSLPAHYVFEFRNFTHWVNKSTSLFKPYKFMPTVCLNTKGEVFFMGVDFMNARDKSLFPVKVYVLNRAEQPENFPPQPSPAEGAK